MSSFRDLLVSTDRELTDLRIKCQEIHSLKSSKEKSQREINRLKGIISSQEKQVSNSVKKLKKLIIVLFQISKLTSDVQLYKTKLAEKGKEAAHVNDQLTKAIHRNEYLMRANSNYESQLAAKAQDIDDQVIRSDNLRVSDHVTIM